MRWVVLTILTPLETNDITIDLNVLPKAIIDRKYFMGQVPVSCFLRKMFRVINVIYFFITKMFKFKKKVKITDLKIICYVVTFSFWEPCSSIQYCCQIVNPNKINMIHSQSHLHTYCTLRMRWWTIWTLLDTFQRIDLVFNIYILVLWYDKHFAITANGFISDIFVWVVQEHVLWYKSQLCVHSERTGSAVGLLSFSGLILINMRYMCI